MDHNGNARRGVMYSNGLLQEVLYSGLCSKVGRQIWTLLSRGLGIVFRLHVVDAQHLVLVEVSLVQLHNQLRICTDDHKTLIYEYNGRKKRYPTWDVQSMIKLDFIL